MDTMTFVDDTLHEHEPMIKQQFKNLMVQKGTRKIEIINGDNADYKNHVRAYVTEGEFEKIYKGLREKLLKRSIYKIQIDKNQFIAECILEINQMLQFMHAKNVYHVEVGKGDFDDSARFIMQQEQYSDKELEIEIVSDPKSDFEIANYIMYHTMLVIDTPYGNYSPDWAMVCRKEDTGKNEVRIYFVVELGNCETRGARLQS